MLMFKIVSLALFALDWSVQTFQQLGILFAAIIGALWLWKSGIPQQLFTGYQSLEKLRTTQRDEAISKYEEAQREIKELKEEVRVLRRESLQRLEINLQDQTTIRELREKKSKGE